MTTKQKKIISSYDACATIEGFDGEEHTQEEEVAAMQSLIDSGQVWSLQGSYGRQAMAMIEAGLCTLGTKGHKDAYGNYVPSRDEVQAGTKGSVEYARERQANQ